MDSALKVRVGGIHARELWWGTKEALATHGAGAFCVDTLKGVPTPPWLVRSPRTKEFGARVEVCIWTQYQHMCGPVPIYGRFMQVDTCTLSDATPTPQHVSRPADSGDSNAAAAANAQSSFILDDAFAHGWRHSARVWKQVWGLRCILPILRKLVTLGRHAPMQTYQRPRRLLCGRHLLTPRHTDSGDPVLVSEHSGPNTGKPALR